MADESLDLRSSERRSVWTSSLITLVGLALFIGITVIIPQPAGRTGLTALGIFLALVPASIWLAFFYQQDRAEPEPARLVIRMFVFGALAGVLVPLLRTFQLDVIDPLPSLILRFLVALFTISLIEEVLKIAMVRYVVLGTNEFDRISDGIVYGMATGIGFATVLTIAYVLQSEGVVPLAGGIRAVNNVLVHGALGAVGGYYIGRVKMDGKNLQWLASGLAIVTVVNAVYLIGTEEVSRSLTFNPWYSLGVSVVLAVVVGAVLFYYFRRALLRDTGALLTVSEQISGRSKIMPWDIHIRYDYLLLGSALLAVIVMVGATLFSAPQTFTYTGDNVGVSFSYPGGWVVEAEEPGEWSARHLTGPGIVKPVFTVTDQKTSNTNLSVLSSNLIAQLQEEKAFFVEIEQQEGLEVAGLPAVSVTYRYAGGTNSGPVVILGTETYVLNGDEGRVYIFQYEAQEAFYDTNFADYQRLLNTAELAQ